jgi:hypothetical protein
MPAHVNVGIIFVWSQVVVFKVLMCNASHWYTWASGGAVSRRECSDFSPDLFVIAVSRVDVILCPSSTSML